jgi:hypothetical protein
MWGPSPRSRTWRHLVKTGDPVPGLETKLQAVDAGLLTPLVRQALGSSAAQVIDWSYSTMSKGRINPVTAGQQERLPRREA